MAPEVIYLFKVNVGIALFYAFYKLLCGRDTFFGWRRIALLSFLLLSFLCPLLNIQDWIKEQPAMSELADYYSSQWMSGASPKPVMEGSDSLPVPDLLSVFVGIYGMGVLFLLIRFLIQLFSILCLVKQSKRVVVNGIEVRSLNSPAPPFSFGKWIFLYLPGLEGKALQEILVHEQTHVCQLHSIDVLVSEWVTVLCWMNPFSWLLKEEIRLNLEYLADRRVIAKERDVRGYQYHLLGLAYKGKPTFLYNNFNVSHLKNRIMMMNKKRTCATGRIKYAFFAPLAALLLLVNNVEAVARTAANLMEETSKAEVVEQKEEKVETPQVPPQEKKNPEIYQIVDEPAGFPGGMNKSMEFINQNIQYPEAALKAKIQGRVIVQFVVKSDGSLDNIKVMRGLSPELDAEAVRIVKSMPKWNPGKQKGKPVNSRFVLPVVFKLPK